MAHQWAFRHRWLTAALHEASGLTSGQRLSAAALWSHMDRNGYCFPAIRTLAKHCKRNERSVRRDLARMVIDGWIARTSRKCNGKAWRRYEYSALIPEGADTTPAPSTQEQEGADKSDTQGADTMPDKHYQSLTVGLAGKGNADDDSELRAMFGEDDPDTVMVDDA